MNKNLLAIIIASFSLTAITLLVTDGWIYLATLVIAIAIIKIIGHFNSTVLKLTRWAKENPRKTQVLITVLQILILSLGLFTGYDLKELGLKLSDTPIIIFGVILISGFLSIRFLPKQNKIVIPVVVKKDRIAYMSIALSAFVVMVITGNRIEDKFPNSFIAHSLRAVDQAIFSERNPSNVEIYSTMEAGTDQQNAMLVNNKSSMLAFASFTTTGDNSVSSTIHPKERGKKLKAENLEKKNKKAMKRLEKLRKAFAAGATIGTILLVILLVITSCAGICLIVAGGSVGAVLAGVAILALSVWGFIKLFKKKKRTNTG